MKSQPSCIQHESNFNDSAWSLRFLLFVGKTYIKFNKVDILK